MCATFTIWMLLVILFLSNARGRLTDNGLPDGQTVAPRGVDHLHFTLSRTVSQRRRKKGGKANARRHRRRFRHSLAVDSPFYTLRDSSCAHASYMAVYDDEGLAGIVRTLPARMLTSVRGGNSGLLSSSNSLTSRDPTFVLFHGGVHCEWSRKFWRVWIEATRRLRGSCLVAIDGATDSMMNYNLMVLGFPTVVRVRTDESRETFRGNRTVEDLIAWVVSAGGIAPLGAIGHRVADDIRWLALESHVDDEGVWQGDVLDIRQETVRNSEQFNWPLLGANLVCFAHVIWGAVSLAGSLRKRRGRRRTGDPDTDEIEEHEHED